MRKILEKLYTFFVLSKVGILMVGAVFVAFWFYRFFNLPFAKTLSTFFDIPTNIFPLPLETYSVSGIHEIENAYFVDGIVCGILSFIFYMCELIVQELQRRYEIYDLRKKQRLENQTNIELKKEYFKNLYSYEYFSVFVKFQTSYISEVLAHNNPNTPEGALKRGYEFFANYVKKVYPAASVKSMGEYVFISGKDFSKFESFFSGMLTIIKQLKKQNEQNFINTRFMIIADAQTSAEESLLSCKKLLNISESEYYNKAIITLEFKTRFELLKSNKYDTELLGFASNGQKQVLSDSDLYYLKTKAKAI